MKLRGQTGFSRRAVLGAGLALGACARPADGKPAPPLAPLKAVAPFPIGTAVMAHKLRDDPAFARIVATQASQITPEFEMKMEVIVRPDGSFDFERPDAIAAFARDHDIRLFGHTLVWYAEKPPAFEQLDARRVSFRDAYANYITAVVGRYRGQAVGWDVVNEAIAEDGGEWRTSLWSERLGAFEHMRLAYEIAHQADPNVRLFLNDYYLEKIPGKRASFMRLAEALLKAGAPLGGIGTQTHIDADLPAGAITAAIKELATLGLPIHLSEMDVSIARVQGFHRPDLLEARQRDLYAEAAHAFSSLPSAQRFAFSLWSLRDSDSWIVRDLPQDTPCLFDAASQPKPALAAVEAAFRGV
jgi:endo-1,4-beta-xylanase